MPTVDIVGVAADGRLSKGSAVSWADCLASSPGTNNSAAYTSASRNFSSPNWTLQRSYFAFDVSAYQGTTITAATLKLHMVSGARAGTRTSKVYYQDWGESLAAADWVDLAGLTLAADSFAPASDTNSIALGNLGSLLTTNGRFVVALADETTEPSAVNYWSIDTAESETEAYRPVLSLTYEGEPPTSTDVTVYSSTLDGRAYGESASYASARRVGVSSSATSTAQQAAGQYLADGLFRCYEGFLAFDTSVIGPGKRVTAVTLKVRPSNVATLGTNFVTQARAYNWGGVLVPETFRSGDPADAGSADEYPIEATLDTDGLTTGDYVAFVSEVDFPAAINTMGMTYLMLTSSRHLAGDEPTGDEYWSLYYADYVGREPKLEITYEDAPSSTHLRNLLLMGA